MKDKLWFFGAFRRAHYDKPIANTFNVPAGANIPAFFKSCLATAGSCDQGVSDEKMDNPVVRLTWQVSPRNKFAAYMDRALRLRGHAMGSLTDPATASVVWHTPTFATGSAKWTSTVSSKLLVETGFSFNRERYDNVYQPGIDQPRLSAGWYAGARKSDNSTQLLWNASSAQLGNYPDKYNASAAVSYVTGSHNLKVGFVDQCGPVSPLEHRERGPLSGLQQRRRRCSVTVLNTPLQTGEYLDANLGLYAQDAWRLNKLTINLGLRFDYLKQHVVGEPAQTGRFENSVAYDDICPAGVEGCVAAHLGRLRRVRHRQDRYSRRLQQVHDRGDDRVRADLQPDGADHAEPGVDRSERRRHRPGRARLRLPHRRLRDRLHQPADELRRPRAVDRSIPT